MSKVPPNARTTPAQRSWPAPARIAARNAIEVPTTVIWFGVTGSEASADINLSAWRRTQASNRVVNIDHLKAGFVRSRGLARHLPGLFVDLDDLRRDRRPRVALRLGLPRGSH